MLTPKKIVTKIAQRFLNSMDSFPEKGGGYSIGTSSDLGYPVPCRYIFEGLQ
jgi:hypothetical protein